MMPRDAYTPTGEDRFTLGLWTVGNPGRDPFGEAVRRPIEPTAVDTDDRDCRRLSLAGYLDQGPPSYRLRLRRGPEGSVLTPTEVLVDGEPVPFRVDGDELRFPTDDPLGEGCVEEPEAPGDAGDDGDDLGSGCGCRTARPGATALSLLVLALLLAARRRRVTSA
jgi:MYXO-CTERM domain-containing protein